MWGRAVFDNIRKFLQFQLTVNVVALTLTFISALTGKEPPLNAVMMLWVNLIMDTMGALALGTEPPSMNLLKRKPFKRNASLISNRMFRNIFFQFVFQMAVLVYLLEFAAPHFNVIPLSTQHLTVVFNAFVFCQVFNEINARSIGNDPNVFRGLAQNPLFIAIIFFTVIAQYFIVEFGGDFVKTAPLTPDQWMKCISLGALSLPVGAIMRLFPISDSEKDFAVVSPLISNHLKQNKADKTDKDSNGSSVFSFSFLLWFVTVTVIPVVTYQQFEDHWRDILMAFVAQVQAQIQTILA
jgi:magnesium-transporting ATPase (P-type)